LDAKDLFSLAGVQTNPRRKLRTTMSKESIIKDIARFLIPKRYRPAAKEWLLRSLGVTEESPPITGVYCGNNRILTSHPCAEFMYVDATDLAVTPRILLQFYEMHVRKVLSRVVKPGFVVVEGGAHNGFHTLTLATLVAPAGHVFAFEPDPRNIAVLRDNIRSHYMDSIVTVIPKAAYHENGSVLFYPGRSGAQSSVFPFQTDKGPWATCYEENHDSKIEVEATTVASVLKKAGLVPDLVRLDVEGAEPMVLDGMWEYLEDCRDILLVFELNPWCVREGGYTSPEEFIRRLDGLGMQFWRIDSVGRLIPTKPDEVTAIRDFEVADFLAARSLPRMVHE
jgi:FkbM family methyltransferase